MLFGKRRQVVKRILIVEDEPLTAFDRDRQVYWRRYVKEGRAVATMEGPGRQRSAVL